ncbi:uncharacterized protein LOC112639559 [Camponotus floridanus]|uniref:uncharacterized protein LOC112639559 n=1 Tax=Camponotus floridanus TaxID=104421 RepID=UPI000DC674FC|nr:uncharacterized protein LOC112639559 [Camponotus floridanus]
MAHKDEIQHQIMKKINPMFLALSETRLIDDIEDSEVNVPGYSIVRCNAENRNTGGVVLYVRSEIKYEIVLVKKLESNCWCAAIEVKDKVYKGVIMVIYHSPSASHGDFMRFYEEIVEELVVKGECIVIGDFNIDLRMDSFYAKKLQATMLSLGMKQYVNEPTRITKDSQTIIDLIFANNDKIVQVIHEPKITDHAWLKVEMNVSKIESKYREFIVRNYKEFDVNEFAILVKNKLQKSQGCQCERMDVSERAKQLIDSIVDALDVMAPKKKYRIPKVWEGKKWFSDDIREAADRRDKAYRRALYDDIEQNWEKKKDYYENMIDLNKENPTSMWKTLKEIISGEPVGIKEVGNIDFEILGDTEECNIADKFNLYYIQSINNIVNSIKIDKSGGDIIDHWMNVNKKTIYIIKNKRIMENFETVKLEQLEKVVMGLPKKKGTEEGITSDIEDSFIGLCPEGWKTSTIIPISKIDKAEKASDYRPINMLSIFEKVLELIVKEQLEMYLEINDIITEHQSGFRKYYSCETAIQTVIDEWKLIVSDKKMVGVIFVDLKRAFETIDRERLLEKMYYYGIRGMALEWFKSYLNNRKQQVRVNHAWSEILTTEYGVPQGSTIIAPHFEYCAMLLIGMGETQITQLQKVQNRAMRVILQCDRYTKVDDMLEALQFMSILNGLLPTQLRNRLQIVGKECDRETRQAGSIELQFRNTIAAQAGHVPSIGTSDNPKGQCLVNTAGGVGLPN